MNKLYVRHTPSEAIELNWTVQSHLLVCRGFATSNWLTMSMLFIGTVEPLLWGHPFCTIKVAFQEGWPLVRGKNQDIYVKIYIVKWPY